MPINVEFHPDTYKELFEDILQKYPGLLEKLKRDFQRYKESDGNFLPDYFGRDVPYVEPHAALKAHLMHIHICLPPGSFPKGRRQIDRTCRSDEPHRDAALVYVQGELEENQFRLIAFLHPNAHSKAQNRQIMTYLARLAQTFRDQN